MIDHLRYANEQSRSCSEMVAVMDKTIRCFDQMLGYQGSDRFVIYYYEPRGEEVVWRDSRSYGFATGAWSTFMDEVGPVAEHYGVDVGCFGTPCTCVLLIDRHQRRAYFAEKTSAIRFLESVGDGSAVVGELQSLGTTKGHVQIVEITHNEVAKLAHQIWERKGRPQGQDLQLWLEAEAELKGKRKTRAGV